MRGAISQSPNVVKEDLKCPDFASLRGRLASGKYKAGDVVYVTDGDKKGQFTVLEGSGTDNNATVIVGGSFYAVRDTNGFVNNLQFGADKELEGVIDFLEKRLQDRNAFNFTLEKEPLRLTNVLYLTDAQGRMLRYRNKKKLRVTYIIDGASTQYAGIQYRGENYTVVMGDSIAGGEVVWIDADEVVIIKGETEYHYSVAGLAEEENITMENKTRNEY